MRPSSHALHLPVVEEGKLCSGLFGIECARVADAGKRGHEGCIALTEGALLLGNRRLTGGRGSLPYVEPCVAGHFQRGAELVGDEELHCLRYYVPWNERRVQQNADEREDARKETMPMEFPQSHAEIISRLPGEGKPVERSE